MPRKNPQSAEAKAQQKIVAKRCYEKAKSTPFTVRQQERAVRKATAAFKAWQHGHVFTCKQLKGICCTECHRNKALRVFDIPKLEGKYWERYTGCDVAYVCCEKRTANSTLLGFNENYNDLRFSQRNQHAVTYEAPLEFRSKDIVKLPDGLLKTYLMQQLAKQAH